MSTRKVGRLILAAVSWQACSNIPASPLGEGGAGGIGNTTSVSAGGASGGASQGGSTGVSSSSGGDPYEAARVVCLDTINALRATKGRAPYSRWTSAEACVDQQATADEQSNSAHGAWSSGSYACNGHAQNECLGAGVDGIETCLESMWGEKDQPGCTGCDACAGKWDLNCPNCDFYGQTTGNVCGHYVSLSAEYFTMAACGFSALGGWDAINFQ